MKIKIFRVMTDIAAKTNHGLGHPEANSFLLTKKGIHRNKAL